MKKSELRKLMRKENTIVSARNELRKIVKGNTEYYEVFVRCYTWNDFEGVSTDLYLEAKDIESEEWHTITIASVELAESEIEDYWKFVEDSRDIFKTMKKNLVAELEKYGYEIVSTEDYNE